MFWHSSAHILGEALENAFGVKLCIGPALKEARGPAGGGDGRLALLPFGARCRHGRVAAPL